MTALDRLTIDWENLAEREALWAIPNDNKTKGRKSDIADFMKTGGGRHFNCMPLPGGDWLSSGLQRYGIGLRVRWAD